MENNRANGSPHDAAQAKHPSLLRSAVHTLGVGILSVPLLILTSIVVARALGPAGKGGYELALATASLLGIVLGGSLPSGVIYVVARGAANLRALAARLFWIVVLQGLAAAAILYALGFTTFSSTFLPPSSTGLIIAAIALLLIFTELSNNWRAMLVGQQEIIRVNTREFIGRAVSLILILLAAGSMTILGQEASFALLIWISVAAAALKNPLFLEALRPSFRVSRGASGLREVVAFALPCYLGSLAQFLNYRLDVFFVSFFSGVTAVGLYTLAAGLGQVIWSVSNAAATVLLPRVASSQKASTENADRAARVTRLLLALSAGAAMALAFVAEHIVIWFYGEAFRGSLAPLFWLLPGIAVFSAANVLASYLAGIGKPQLNLTVSLAGLLVTVALDILLIPRYGIAGAAVASTASYTTSTCLIVWFFMRESGQRLRAVVVPTIDDVRLMRSAAFAMFSRA
jgi:O-antigen/teichoic acid export membrane protein